MAMETQRPNRSMQARIEARKRHHLSHAQVQMARDLAMNPGAPDLDAGQARASRFSLSKGG
jgi:hypothetical protein